MEKWTWQMNIFLASVMKVTQDAVRLKVKTDWHGPPPCGFCGRVTLSSSNYVFCSHKHVFKGFSLFVRDDWRFCCHKKTSFEFSLPSIIAHFLKKHHCSSSSLHLSSTKKKLWLVAHRSSSHTSGMYILCSCS